MSMFICKLPGWVRDLYWHLIGESYTEHAALRVVEYALAAGTVEGCPVEMEDADRAACEDLIPADPRWRWPVWDEVFVDAA